MPANAYPVPTIYINGFLSLQHLLMFTICLALRPVLPDTMAHMQPLPPPPPGSSAPSGSYMHYLLVGNKCCIIISK